MKIEENLKLSLLFDIYKNLLTQKQKEVLSDFLDNNISLTELAQINNSTRQAVNDLVKRTIKVLENYEGKLCLLAKFEKVKESIANCEHILKENKINLPSLVKELNCVLEVL